MSMFYVSYYETCHVTVVSPYVSGVHTVVRGTLNSAG